LLLSYDGHRNSGSIVGKELFFFKYYSIAFFILPGVAGGLALELRDGRLTFLLESTSDDYGVGTRSGTFFALLRANPSTLLRTQGASIAK
jgi:hypothetical protein